MGPIPATLKQQGIAFALSRDRPGWKVSIGIDRLAFSSNPIMCRLRVAKIIQGHVRQLRPFLLQSGKRLETLAPVEVGVRQNPTPTQRTSSDGIEIRQLIRVDPRHCGRVAGDAQLRLHIAC